MASSSGAEWRARLQLNIKQADFFSSSAEMLVMACNDSFAGSLLTLLQKKMQPEAWAKALKEAHLAAGSKKLRNGEVLIVELPPSSFTRFVALVVSPEQPYLSMAYRAVLSEAARRGCLAVTMPCLGCGQCGVEPRQSAKKLLGVLDETSEFGQLQTLNILDQNKDAVERFRAAIEQIASGEEPADDSDPVAATIRKITHRPDQVENDSCVVCMDGLGNGEHVVALNVCNHQIHFDCFLNYMKNAKPKSCHVCKKFYLKPEGNMPPGTMHVSVAQQQVPGYPDAQGCIVISYSFHGGVQGPNHLRPGVPFSGTRRTAYLPNNEKGQRVLALLRRAFDCRLTFAVGDSITSGAQNTVVWNNIHHKTSLDGGSANYGYPDPEYLDRVTAELAAAGIEDGQ